MLTFSNTIIINRPVDEVFDFLSNFENIPKWNYYVVEVNRLSDGDIQKGTAFHQIRKTDEQTFQIVEYQPNRVVGVQTGSNASPQFEIKFTLQPDNGSTKLLDEWKLETGQPALLERFALGKIRSAVADNLKKLKQLLETGKVTLQDGRKVRI